MPSEISSDTKSMIIALRPEGYSMPKIVEKLKQLGKSASLMTVRRVLQRQKLEQQGVIRKKKKLPRLPAVNATSAKLRNGSVIQIHQPKKKSREDLKFVCNL